MTIWSLKHRTLSVPVKFDSKWNIDSRVADCVWLVSSGVDGEEIRNREDLEDAWIEKKSIKVKFRSLHSNYFDGPVLVYGVYSLSALFTNENVGNEVITNVLLTYI